MLILPPYPFENKRKNFFFDFAFLFKIDWSRCFEAINSDKQRKIVDSVIQLFFHAVIFLRKWF